MAKGKEPEAAAGAAGTLRDYEDSIRQIREVIAARVVAGPDGAIEEIHVLAGSGRGPKQIVRDIESSLMARFGVAVDHKKISVAQIGEGLAGCLDQAGPASGPPGGWGVLVQGRLRLVGVRHTVDSTRAEAEVRVELDGRVSSGQAAGPASAANRLRVAAEAALNAVADYFRPNYELVLEDAAVITLHGRRVALSMMCLLSSSGEEALVGACLVRSGEVEAIVRSVLDALNRRFAVLARCPGASVGGDERQGQAGGG